LLGYRAPARGDAMVRIMAIRFHSRLDSLIDVCELLGP